MKLYPPKIPGSIPAASFSDSGTIIKVPFQLNPAVGINEVKGFKLKIKEIQSNSLVEILDLQGINSDSDCFKNQYLEFNWTKSNDSPKIGQSYKLQLACYDSDDNSDNVDFYYSDVGIIKIIGQISLNLSPTQNLLLNDLKYSFFSSQILEKLYSYCFKIYYKDNNGNNIVLFENEEKIIDNNNQKYEFISDGQKYETDIYIKIPLNEGVYQQVINNKCFFCEFIIKTINGYIKSHTWNFNFNFEEKNDLQEKIIFEKINNNYLKIKNNTINQKFLIFKSPGNLKINLNSEDLYIDNILESDKEYFYHILEYKAYDALNLVHCYLVYPSKKLSFNFDSIYLSDNKKNLEIKFNPKISSFKQVVQEQKIDTLGNSYPIFARNGNIKYHEFPISGLISYHMDENQEFFKFNENKNLIRKSTLSNDTISDYNSSSLTDENIYKERIFKREVLDWLNNGQPKLFRSPTEGNFIVRLMNCSLTPNDTLGRMIHSFSATAYEIADCTMENLEKYNLLFEPLV